MPINTNCYSNLTCSFSRSWHFLCIFCNHIIYRSSFVPVNTVMIYFFCTFKCLTTEKHPFSKHNSFDSAEKFEKLFRILKRISTVVWKLKGGSAPLEPPEDRTGQHSCFIFHKTSKFVTCITKIPNCFRIEFLRCKSHI